MPETPELPADQPERVAVGRINAPWGVRGHAKVTPYTNNPGRLVKGARVYVAGEPTAIVEVRTPQGYPVILFEGITTPEAVQHLKDALIEIDEGELPDLPEDEHYIHDLIGLEVVTAAGVSVGTIEDVLRTGSNDVYLVHAPGGKEVLIPVLEGIVLEVDVPGGRVVIDPVPGLLD